MCIELLPPGGYPTAVNKYILSYHIKRYETLIYQQQQQQQQQSAAETFVGIDTK
jgi:hypothetical protein